MNRKLRVIFGSILLAITVGLFPFIYELSEAHAANSPLAPIPSPYSPVGNSQTIDMQVGRYWEYYYIKNGNGWEYTDQLPNTVNPKDWRTVQEYFRNKLAATRQEVKEGDFLTTFLLTTIPPDILFAQFIRRMSGSVHLGDSLRNFLIMDRSDDMHRQWAQDFNFPPAHRITKWPAEKNITIAFQHYMANFMSEKKLHEIQQNYTNIIRQESKEVSLNSGLSFSFLDQIFRTHDTRGLYEKEKADLIILLAYGIAEGPTGNDSIIQVEPALRHGSGYVLLDRDGFIKKAFCVENFHHKATEMSLRQNIRACLLQAAGIVMLENLGEEPDAELENKILSTLYDQQITAGMSEQEVRAVLKKLFQTK